MSDEIDGTTSGDPASRVRMMIYQPRMSPGGAQKITLTLLRHLDKERFDPVLVVRSREGEWLGEVPPNVPVLFLETRVRFAWYKFKRLLQRTRPDVLLSMSSGGNLTACLAHLTARVECPLVVAEHNHFSLAWRTASRIRFQRVRLLKHILYRRADRVIAVSAGVGEDLIRSIGIKRSQLLVIHNPIVEPELLKRAEESVAHPWFLDDVPIILAVGRLVLQKDYPTLLDAFCRVRLRGPTRLVILGDGELRDQLEDLARSRGVQDDVAFLGFVPNPPAYMKRCTVFVLSSRFEGFGNVLVEAMACGAPVVSTDCPSGPNEIISNGNSGLLVPVGDSRALAKAISALLDDDSFRGRISESGEERAKTFSVDNAVVLYGELLEELVKAHGNRGGVHAEEPQLSASGRGAVSWNR